MTASHVGLILAAALLSTGCEEKKETLKPDTASAAAKATATAAAKEAAPAKAAGTAMKKGKAGKCGADGKCGKGSCG